MIKSISTLLPLSIKEKLKPSYLKLKLLITCLKNNNDFFIGKIKRLIRRPDFPPSDRGLFVNLGCGLTNHPKFINIDGYPHPHVHYVNRIDHLNMFDKNSVDLIYASHCLEHFKYREIDRVLEEWCRVIQPGGILRLSVPDFDKLLNIYNETGDPDDIIEQLMGGQNNKYNFHYIIFNRKNLTNYLIRNGFVDIQEWFPDSCELTTFDDFSIYQKLVKGKKYPISLNLEAKKAETK